MAQHVLVENYGKMTYSEKFMGRDIVLKPGQKIKMQRREASKFLGTMSDSGFVDENGNIDMSKPKEKKLRMIINDKSGVEVEKHVSNYDGIEFDNEEDLNKHLQSLSDKNVDMDESGSIVKVKAKK